jgi:hypothetical protein
MKTHLLLAAATFVAASAGATTLTFDGTGQNIGIPNTFGDNATIAGTGFNVTNGTTPNINLTWSAAANGGAGVVAWEFYNGGEWTGAQLNDAFPSGLAVFGVTFAPTAGFAVQLNSFTFDPWGTAQHNFDWRVVRVADSTIATSGSTGLFTANTAVNINFTATDSSAYRLELQRNAVSPGSYTSGDSIAIDNLSFNQVSAVPEPSTYGLIGAGALAAVAVVRRRRKLAGKAA